MLQKQLKWCLVPMFAFVLAAGMQAQESVCATGGIASGSGGSVSYSVGQVVYEVQTGTTGSVVQGVQQPYEISVVSAVEEVKDMNLSVSAYPNPTADCLTLEIQMGEISSLSFQLYDIQGKLLQCESISEPEVQIELTNYASSTYFVRVLNGAIIMKEFKVIKN